MKELKQKWINWCNQKPQDKIDFYEELNYFQK